MRQSRPYLLEPRIMCALTKTHRCYWARHSIVLGPSPGGFQVRQDPYLNFDRRPAVAQSFTMS